MSTVKNKVNIKQNGENIRSLTQNVWQVKLEMAMEL